MKEIHATFHLPFHRVPCFQVSCIPNVVYSLAEQSMPSAIFPGSSAAEGSIEHTQLSFGALQQTEFDAVAYLNDTLPPLILSSQQTNQKSTRATQIQAATTETQTLLSKLNSQNIRASTELTALVDDILRSGSRLAYEVEVLRGDANSLHELLSETLQDDIRQFVDEEADSMEVSKHGLDEEERDAPGIMNVNGPRRRREPEFMQQLRMYTQVKTRLESVVNVFGEALKWPLPPTDPTASLISVSNPELGLATSAEDEKAQKMLEQYRAEIISLFESDGGGYAGLEAASRRVDGLRLLAGIWKGTSEEKARTRFVDNLSKLVEDRRKALDVRSLPQRTAGDSSNQRSSSMPGRAMKAAAEGSSAASGLFRNLQKLRDEIYLD